MTLLDYCHALGWSRAELGRRAGIDAHTAGNAIRGQRIASHVARKIAQALTDATGNPVHVGDIQELNVGK